MNQFSLRAAVALLQGGLLWWLYRAIEQKSWPATDRGWLVGLIAPVVLVPIAYYLTVELCADRRRFLILPTLALALFGFGWHHGAWTANEISSNSFAFALALVVLVFHALPFVQVWLANRRWRPRYDELFQYAWRNTLLLAFGGVFCGVFWVLLALWGTLFRMLGVDFFRELFTESYFAIPATTVAAGVGLQLAGSVERLQGVLRNQLLAMLKWLAPLAILILAMFTLTLLVKTPDLLLEQRRVIDAAWLLWLVAMTVALLNAAYQDGRGEAPYPPWLGRSMRLVVPLLLPVAVLAAYAIGVRIASYGLTVERAWASLVAVIGLAYAAGYAWAAWRRDSWMAGIGAVNVAVALGTVLLLTLMLTPALAPERLAANSQYRQVLERQEASSYRHLRFETGEYGRAALARLAALQEHPQADAIRAAAKLELERPHPYAGQPVVDLRADQFEVFPEGLEIDAGLLDALQQSQDGRVMQQCTRATPCPVLLADLGGDSMPEALVFSDYMAIAARREGAGWRLVENASLAVVHPDRNRLRQALSEGRYDIRAPDWNVVEIEGQVYLLEEPRSKRGDPAPAAIEQAP